MATWLDSLMSFRKARVSPMKEVGTGGTAIYGGFIQNDERNPKISSHQERYRTAADLLSNISIIAAGVRYFLNLTAKPKWSVDPVDDSAQAKVYAEFVEAIINEMTSPWNKVVRRSSSYRYHGFSIQAWTAKKRADGTIGIEDIESRPQFTIERWEPDENGTIIGMWQRSPQDGRELWLPRNRLLYMVDDTLTDSPEGMGWFRHLVEPAERLKAYLNLESMGFERDLSGIPVGRAPLAAINDKIRKGELTAAQGQDAIRAITNFVQLNAKKKNTGIVLDSQHFTDTGSDGNKTTGVPQWGIELLTASSASMAQMAAAIERIKVEMAMIMGVENIMIGTNGEGSLALSRDKSNNLYLQVNSTLVDMAEQFTKDLIDPIWAMNGLPDEFKPRLKTEDVAFRDVEQVTTALASMAQAGAVLAPDDPAIDDVRDLLGVSRRETGESAVPPPAAMPGDVEDPEEMMAE